MNNNLPQPLGRARRAKRAGTEDPNLGQLIAQATRAAEDFFSHLESLGLSRETIEKIMQGPAAMAFIPLVGFAGWGNESEFSPRVEANALTAAAFRNGPLEDYHASGMPIGNTEMRGLMISASRRMNALLQLRDILLSDPGGKLLWQRMIVAYHKMFCRNWENTDIGESIW